MFGGGKSWQITGSLLNFTIQILTMSRKINKATEQAGIQTFSYSPKVSDEKIAEVSPPLIHAMQ